MKTGLIEISFAVLLTLVIVHAQRKKEMKWTSISDPFTTIRNYVYKGKSLIVALLGLCAGATLFMISGLGKLHSILNIRTSLIIDMVGIFLCVLGIVIASIISDMNSDN